MKVSSFVSLYGGDDDAVSVGAKTVARPQGLDALPADFTEVGFLDADAGVGRKRSVDKKRFKAHQGGKTVKVRVTSVEDSFEYTAIETNETVLSLNFKGAAVTVAAGVAHIEVADQTKTDNRVTVIDLYSDEGYHTRMVGLCEHTCEGESYKLEDLTAYPFVADVIGDWDIYSNHPGLTGAAA